MIRSFAPRWGNGLAAGTALSVAVVFDVDTAVEPATCIVIAKVDDPIDKPLNQPRRFAMRRWSSEGWYWTACDRDSMPARRPY